MLELCGIDHSHGDITQLYSATFVKTDRFNAFIFAQTLMRSYCPTMECFWPLLMVMYQQYGQNAHGLAKYGYLLRSLLHDLLRSTLDCHSAKGLSVIPLKHFNSE